MKKVEKHNVLKKNKNMKKVTSKNITTEQIEEANKYLGYYVGSRELSDYGYSFYFNQMNNGLNLCDADRYANLNTILGYDVGVKKFRSLDNWLWEHDFDLMELVGSEEDKEMLKRATTETKTKELDYSKWENNEKKEYSYSFFEGGIRYE